MIEVIKPIPDGTYPPKIEGAEEDITKDDHEIKHILYMGKLTGDS